MRARRLRLLSGLLLGLLLGGSVPALPQSLDDTSQRLQRDILRLTGAGQYPEALKQAEALLTLLTQTDGVQKELIAQALSATAMLTWLQGNPHQGKQLYQQALQLLETMRGPEDRALVPLLMSWGMLARDYGDFQEAEQLLTRGLSLTTLSALVPTSETLTILTALAGVYEDLGNYARAEQALQKALQTIAPEQRDTEPRLLPVLHGLGRIAHARGAWNHAATWFYRALRLHSGDSGDDAAHTQFAGLLIDLATLHQDQGDYVQAEVLLHRARTHLEQRWGEDSLHIGPALYGLARLALTRGDYHSAQALLEQHRSSLERTYGKASHFLAPALLGLGVIWAAEGRYAAATGVYQHVLALWEHTLGKEHPSVAYVLYNLAILYKQQGHLAEAEPLYQRAMHIWQKALGLTHPLVAAVMSHLGTLAEARHDLEQASQWFTNALTVWQQTAGEDAPENAIAFSGLARVHVRRGELSQAITLLAQSNEILEKTLYRNLRSGSEQQRHLYLTTQLVGSTHQTLTLHLQLAPHNTDAARLALRTVLRRKGILLEAQVTSQQLVRQQLDDEGRQLLASLEEYRQLRTSFALTRDTIHNATEEEEIAFASALDELIEESEQALSRKMAPAQEQAALPTLAAIAQQLPQDACLIEFVTYTPLGFGYASPESSEPSRRYAAYVLHRDGTLYWADLGDAEVIDKAISALRRTLQHPLRHEWQHASQSLYQHIMQPLVPWLGHAYHLLLSPDGDLHLLPFAALRDAQGTLLLERYKLTYLTTGRELLRPALPQPDVGPPVIFAGPDFDAHPPQALPVEASSSSYHSGTTSQSTRILPSFSPLPGAMHEGSLLQQSLPQAMVVIGAEATEARLKAVQRPRLLHIATHGFFLPAPPPPQPAHEPFSLVAASGAPRGIAITPDVAQGAGMESVATNPLLRAGLVFAGVNQPPAGQEDGILTALEATTLDLRGTSLVVLSACETGIGEIRNGESVYGLRRAFTIAGAESQVTTLWKVADAATQTLMVAYYQRLLAGEERSEALRQVQLEQAHSQHQSHPFYWAAFLLSGRWGPL